MSMAWKLTNLATLIRPAGGPEMAIQSWKGPAKIATLRTRSREPLAPYSSIIMRFMDTSHKLDHLINA